MRSVDAEMRAIRAVMKELRKARGGEQGRPTVFTITEAAEESGMTLGAFRVLLRTRVVMTTVVGRRRVVPLSEIERLKSRQ